MKHLLILLFSMLTFSVFAQSDSIRIVYPVAFPEQSVMTDDTEFYMQVQIDGVRYGWKFKGPVIRDYVLKNVDTKGGTLYLISAASDTSSITPIKNDMAYDTAGQVLYIRGVGFWQDIPVGGGGGNLSDGDKGDVTVSGSGTVWDINTAAVDYADLSQAVKDSIGASSGNLRYDINRLPYINKRIPALGLYANENVASYPATDLNANKYEWNDVNSYGAGGENGGWLANGTNGDSVTTTAPFWVVIGDSQAEGAPNLSGRLDRRVSSGFDPTWQDTVGQLSYHLRELTKVKWYNQGIGSQTSTQVLARFRRDALGQTIAVGDGRPNQTLDGVPQGVVLVVGINDFYNGLLVADLQTNLTEMARLANSAGVYLVMLNIPGDEINNATQNLQVDSINTWLSEGNLNQYGTVIVDYNSWWRDPAYDDNFHGNSLLADDIHPSQVGYDSLANYIYNQAKIPRLDSIIFYNSISPAGLNGYSRPNSVRLNGNETVSITNEVETVGINTPLKVDSVSYSILGSTNVTGTSFSGFSHIEYIMSNAYAGDVVTRKEKSVFIGGNSSSKWAENNNNLSPSESEKISIGTTNQYDSNTTLTIKDNSTTNTNGVVITDANNTGKFFFSAGSGRLGINRSPVYNLDVGGTANFVNGNNYTFINGSNYQIYGSPVVDFQSTGEGVYKQISFRYLPQSNTFDFIPRVAPNGEDTKFSFYNLTGVFAVIDGINEGIVVGNNTAREDIDVDNNILLRGANDGNAVGSIIFEEKSNSNTNHISLRPQENLSVNTNYILPPGGNPGEKLTYNTGDSLSWESGVQSIYTTSASLTSPRTVDLDGNSLVFLDTAASGNSVFKVELDDSVVGMYNRDITNPLTDFTGIKVIEDDFGNDRETIIESKSSSLNTDNHISVKPEDVVIRASKSLNYSHQILLDSAGINLIFSENGVPAGTGVNITRSTVTIGDTLYVNGGAKITGTATTPVERYVLTATDSGGRVDWKAVPIHTREKLIPVATTLSATTYAEPIIVTNSMDSRPLTSLEYAVSQLGSDPITVGIKINGVHQPDYDRLISAVSYTSAVTPASPVTLNEDDVIQLYIATAPASPPAGMALTLIQN